jgi:hypothetical protein
VPLTATATDVPLSVVLWNGWEATEMLDGPRPLPLATNTEFDSNSSRRFRERLHRLTLTMQIEEAAQ